MTVSEHNTQVVVEGNTDEPIVRALMTATGWVSKEYTIFCAKGKGNIVRKIAKHAEAARQIPRILFLDSDNKCPVDMRKDLEKELTHIPADFILRIVCTCIESWVLADREGLASFCGVDIAAIPASQKLAPIHNHKNELLKVLRKSKSPKGREMTQGSGNDLQFSDDYTRHLADLMTNYWDAERAAQNNDSLRRAIAQLKDLRARLSTDAVPEVRQ